jgi:oxalate decarboxylase
MPSPEPIRNGTGASILGPRNSPLELENPSLLAPPPTDAGTIPNLKFSFSAARNRLVTGGWAREVTERELPVATTLAGVNMRLKPGGIREMHHRQEAFSVESGIGVEWGDEHAHEQLRNRVDALRELGRTV